MGSTIQIETIVLYILCFFKIILIAEIPGQAFELFLAAGAIKG